MAGPGDQMAADAAGRGRLRASHADREHVIDMLAAAFVQGRLTKDEFDVRLGQTFASRTHAELAAITADIPAGLVQAQPPRKPTQAQPRPPMSTGAKSAIAVGIAAALLAASFFLGAYAVRTVVSFYFFALLVAGAQMLDSRHQKRFRGQLPQGPAAGADRKASQRTASAADAEQLPQANQGPRHAAEAVQLPELIMRARFPSPAPTM